jgi:hypothetical protein
MGDLSENVIREVAPPTSIANMSEAAVLLSDPACHSVCLESAFRFLRARLVSIFKQQLPGDVMLVGVWRGGLAAFIQAVLTENQQTHRCLYLSDTFNGFMPVGPEYPKDLEMSRYFAGLEVPAGSGAGVLRLMDGLGLPTSNVRILEGDVAETTREFDESLCMLMIDVDFYTPTINSLTNMYSSLVSGGVVYVDDYHVDFYECKDAVDGFLEGLAEPPSIERVNEFAISWLKQ